ncbi:unnamed protein product [Closterium sp. NIES-65]|nr:unnamed protein product [Closterium sp. NIES-65]
MSPLPCSHHRIALTTSRTLQLWCAHACGAHWTVFTFPGCWGGQAHCGVGIRVPVVGGSESLKHPTMDAPGDVVQYLAELAVSCTVERTASRPSMAHIVTQLQAVREEVAGKEESGAAIKVDAQVQEMKDSVAGEDSLEAQLQMIADRGSFITEHPV